jgi:hypothetical protein
MLRRLLDWQERTRQQDPVNFKRKRRLVSGLREVRGCGHVLCRAVCGGQVCRLAHQSLLASPTC